MLGDREIVSDEEIREAKLPAKLLEQVEDLCLHGEVDTYFSVVSSVSTSSIRTRVTTRITRKVQGFTANPFNIVNCQLVWLK